VYFTDEVKIKIENVSNYSLIYVYRMTNT
jgi:hypothetical protein